MAQPLPQRFGRYILTQLIGEGGMAEVYLASVRVAEGLTKRVVIKKIRKDFADHHEFTRMFVDEAKIALSLNHANIVQVFDFGQVQGAFYLAMEQVEGVDVMRLFHAVKKAGDKFPAVVAAYLGHQIAAALTYAHRKTDDHGRPLGIVHRDVSPHNVMVSYEGHVKILDFGIARTGAQVLESIDGQLRRVGGTGNTEETIKGKVAYMSPEQAIGRPVDARSDVYSLGVVLHELVTGKLLFRTKDRLAALEMVRATPVVPLANADPDAPEELCDIVDKALARDPEERYESARQMQSALAAYLHHADPVVDDEALSTFVAQYMPRRPVAPLPDIDDLLDVDVAPTPGTPYPRKQSRSSERIVVLYVALSGEPLMPDDEPADPEPFLGLASDIAFKYDAQVLQKDDSAVVMAFGTLLATPEDLNRAVQAAMALREDGAEMAPGLRIGLVLARAQAVVQRDASGNVQVELKRGVGNQLDSLSRHHLDGALMVTGNLVESLSDKWRFGEGGFVEAQFGETLSVVDRELEHIAPLLGRVLNERRDPVVPGGRLLLYGRELELKALRDTFSESIRNRQSRAVLVLGEPGLGKRALVERFVSSLPRTACWILRASGSFGRRNVAMGVFLDLLERFLSLEHTSTPADIVSRLHAHGIRDAEQAADALAAALGLPGAGGQDLDPFTRRDRLWRLVRRLITSLAQRRPVLVVVENIHLVDEQSILLLREWVQNRVPWPIMGLTTGRPRNRRVEQIRRESNVAIIELDELDHRSRRDLIVRRFEDPDSAQSLADSILARTGGNPLFIEQALASLLDRGAIAWNPQGRSLVVKQSKAPIELPKSAEAVLAERIDQLSDSDREVLQGAAILGRMFRPHELGDLLERSVGKSLDNLVERHFLERITPQVPLGESLRFATVSLYEVCRSSLPKERGVNMHAKAAELIKARPDYSPERDDGAVAEHLLNAERTTEAIEPAMAAAMRAYDLAGNVEAYHHLTQALRAMPDGDDRRWEALLRRERILRAWGRRRAQGMDVRSLLRIAEESGDPARQAIASIRLLRFYLEVGRIQQAERLVPRVEERIADVPSPAPFLAVLGELRSELMFMQGDFEAAEQIARDALKYCATDARGARQRCRLLRSIGQVKNSVGRYAEAREVYDEALGIARRIGNQRLEANILNSLGEVAGRSAHYQEAVDRFKGALAIDRDLGDRFATGRKLANLGITYAAIGLHGRAEQFLRKSLEMHEAVGHPGEFNDVIVHLGEVVAASGDVDAARTLLLDAARAAAARGDIRTELRARIRLAAALVREGASEEDLEAARITAEQVLQTARSQGLRTSRARALHVLARLCVLKDDPTEAIEYEKESVTLVRAGAAPLDGVRSIHHLGCLLRKTGDDAEARSLLREAAAQVQGRIDDLRDEDLRDGYLEQADAKQILEDGQDAG